MASTMNRELVVTMYKTIGALDQVHADLEWLEGEVGKNEALGPVEDVPVDEDADAEAHVIVEQLSLLHERGVELLELLRRGAVEDDGRLDAQ